MANVPVAYSDVGKSVNDLLGKDYPTGAVKLEVKTTAANGVTFTVNGAKDNKSGGIAGELKTKWADKAKGLTVTESWTTGNVLSASVELQDTITSGLKLSLDAALLPAIGQRNAKVGYEYKQDYIYTRASLDLFKGPTLFSDAVVGSDGFLVGGEVAYDIHEAKVTKSNVAFGYTAKDYALALTASNAFSLYSAAYYHRVSADVEAGAKATWDSKAEGSAVGLEVGSKYVLDRDSFVKAKINNGGILGLGYTQTLRPGVKLTLAGSFDTARLQENVHKLGVSFTLEN